tara:strand:- start:2564 stop:7543 length:4980 start_codon:yes stop_codon:yes gene_type:complete
MPEIKNTFQKGIMNKDLDERLVPNGQYRDAMNIQVSTSDESEVGTVQNILGNTRVGVDKSDIFYDTDLKCVAAISDEKNDVLYYLLNGRTKDFIIEYAHDGTETLVFVDITGDTLKFHPDNIITGINIIDNLLFWTDNTNEPKKINIDSCKAGTTNVNTQTNLIVNGVNKGPITLENITVIRKRPTKAPDVKFIETSFQEVIQLPQLNFFGLVSGQEMFPGFPGYDATTSAIDYSIGYAFPTPTGIIAPFDIGDFILLSEPNVSGQLPQNYQVKLLITDIIPYLPGTFGTGTSNGSFYNFEIVEILDNFDNEKIDFDSVKFVDTKPIFEKEFIRFATRYKYIDGEYSAYSPFTQPVFVSGRFGFHPTKDPYNLGMENKLLNIRLDNLIETTTPKDVVQLDILFKKDKSPIVYSIDSIKPNDPTPTYWENSDFTGGSIYSWNGTSFINSIINIDEYPKGQYEITVENIYAALPENQMLRPWDNVPRKALAQEITGNRLVYANYLQNYNNIDENGNIASPDIIVDKEERGFYFNEPVIFSENKGLKSIKSLRTYYLGVVYGDEYGRETPIFTNKQASINIPYEDETNLTTIYNPAKSLRLIAKINGTIPSWAHYYKFFIKQTTGEYYNLTLDRVYKSQADQNLWLSFPSSDRNKIKEGDYIILKKQVDIEQVVPVEEKIKIIDIKNEAPESIKYNYMICGTGGGSAVDNSALFPDINQQPSVGVGKLLIDAEAWIDTEGGLDLEDAITPSDKLAVQFSTNQGGLIIKSKKYFVSSFAVITGGNQGRYQLLLQEVIDSEDSWVESSLGVLNSADAFSITIFKLQNKDITEFEGRFFVKVISNAVTQTYLIPSISDVDNYRVLGKMNTFTLANTPSIIGTSAIAGIYNTQQSTWTGTTASSLTNTEAEWDIATRFDTGTGSSKGFFIDNTYFVAAQQQQGANVNAGNSGRLTKGNPLASAGSQYINGLEGIVTIDSNTGPYNLNAQNQPNGPRHWKEQIIKMKDYQTTFQYEPSGGGWDNTYVPLQSGHIMHLSYSCIGEDLHDGTGFSSYQNWINWINGLPSGNMAKFKWPGNWVESQKIYATKGFVNTTSLISPLTPDYFRTYGQFDTDNYGDWSNLTSSEKEISNNQFNPSHWDIYADSIIKNLIPGNRFQIDGDTHGEVYTILKVTEKWLYNHTAWNLVPTWDVTGTTLKVHNHNGQNYGGGTGYGALPSICEAFSKFVIDQTQNLHEVFKNTLVNFGKANNRRVCYVLELDKNPTNSPDYPVSLGSANAITPIQIRFVDNYIEDGQNTLPTSPAIFETEAKEDVDLNIYYEASDVLPTSVNTDTNDGYLLAPIGSRVICNLSNSDLTDWDLVNNQAPIVSLPSTGYQVFLKVLRWDGNKLFLTQPGLEYDATIGSGLEASDYIGKILRFIREDGSYTQAKIDSIITPSTGNIIEINIEINTATNNCGLSYYNCFSFGNGVESNRIRDDFNESYILNGVKASTVLEEPYEEERRKYGLIYSGLYNSTSGVNNLNQFIQAEKITKDINPTYGSIQKLYARTKDLVTLCEDKILQIFVDRDLLFNADGNTQLLSSNRFLGTIQPFRGEFGISKDPESFASESFRAYFTDRQRGAVLRLSIDGLTPISDAGMRDYFRDNLKKAGKLYGSYDSYKGHYNLTIK